jgi:hypothetical protein
MADADWGEREPSSTELEQRDRIGDFLKSGAELRNSGSYRQTELRVWTENEAWVRNTFIKEMVDNAFNIMEGSRLCMMEMVLAVDNFSKLMVDVQAGRPILNPIGQGVGGQPKVVTEKKNKSGTRSVKEFFKPVRVLQEDNIMLEVEKERRLEMAARLKLQFRARRMHTMLVDWTREVVDHLVKEVCTEGGKRVDCRVKSILTEMVESIPADHDDTQELPQLQMTENVCVSASKDVLSVSLKQKTIRKKVWAKGKNGLYGWRMAADKNPTRSEFVPAVFISSKGENVSKNAHNSKLESNARKNNDILQNSTCEQQTKRKYESEQFGQVKRRRNNPEDTGGNYWVAGNGTDKIQKGL